MAFVNDFETNDRNISIEQWSAVQFAEQNSDHSNFLFSSRKIEYMYKEKISKCK